MYLAASLSALLLFAVFTIAAAAKLADLAGSRQAVEEFGAPRAVASAVGTLLPFLELTVAGLLLFAATAEAGAFGAIALLALFSAAIGLNLARGRTPDCRCFGQVRPSPIGSSTLARNGALIAVAAGGALALAAEPEASAVAWLGRVDSTSAALVVAAAATAAAVAAVALALQVLRGHGRLLLRIDQLEAALAHAGIEVPQLEEAAGLAVRSKAPDFRLPGMDGREIGLDELISPDRSLLLIFTETGCAPCRELLPEVSEWQVEDQDALTIAIAAAGPSDEVHAVAGEHELVNVLLDTDAELFERYQADVTPSGVLIDAEARIASSIAAGPDRIRALRARAPGRQQTRATGPAVGEPAPRLELPLLGGGTVEIGDPGDGERLLLFWDPSCGYCRQMHSELLRCEEGPRNGSPELLLISSGNEEATRGEGFRSQVALDRDSRASKALSAGGTPMAVLVDDQARIASGLAAGADEVLALARGKALAGL